MTSPKQDGGDGDRLEPVSLHDDSAPQVPDAHDSLLAAMEDPAASEEARRRGSIDGSVGPSTKSPEWQKLSTTIMINLAGVMERTDEQLLPSVYKYVACSFNANLEQLGYVTMGRALVQSLACPVGGLLGHYFDRVNVIAAGCFIWGVMSFLFSMTNSWQMGTLTWAWNGIGLALVVPNSQSLIADYYEDIHRGKAFGTLGLTGSVGAMLGTLFATNIAGITVMGTEGWRWAFRFVALNAVLTGIATLCFAKDPTVCKGHHVAPAHDHKFSWAKTWSEFKQVLRVPTFQIIIVQGILGSTPWNALVFLTLYLLLLGFTNLGASVVLTVFLGGAAVGSLIGGVVGDWAARWHADYGRIAVCQFSVFVGIPFSLVVIKGLPISATDTTPVVVLYSVVMFMFGALHTWAAPACNNPIFAEIVPPSLRSLIYAFDRSFEGAIAALGAPLVGVIASNMFNFPVDDSYTCVNGKPVDSNDTIGERTQMADALGSAMLVCMIVPWTLCLVIYTGLYWTYPADRRRVEEAEPMPVPTTDIDGEGLLDGSAARSHTATNGHASMNAVWSEILK